MKAQAVCSEWIVFFAKLLKWVDGGFLGTPLQLGKTQVHFCLPPGYLGSFMDFNGFWASKAITFTRGNSKMKMEIPFR